MPKDVEEEKNTWLLDEGETSLKLRIRLETQEIESTGGGEASGSLKTALDAPCPLESW